MCERVCGTSTVNTGGVGWSLGSQRKVLAPGGLSFWPSSLRNKDSHRVLPKGLGFHPDAFASEKPFFEERVCQGFLLRLEFY